jgi:RND family efflux transporter MFP subunit
MVRLGLPIYLFSGLLLVSCSPEPAAGNGDGAPADLGAFTFPVTFVEIGPGTVSEVVDFTGDVATRRRGQLAFERAGRIIAMEAEEGDRVELGQLLARLDDQVLQAQLGAAQAAMAAAEAELAYAKQELERYEAMANAAAESDRDLWRSEVAIRGATAAQRAAESLRLEREIAQGELRAPFGGILVARGLILGSYANPGEMVFELVDLENREVRLELPQDLAVGIPVGTPVEIHSAALPDGMLSATLDAVLPSARSDSRTFTGLVRLGPTLDSDLRLLPGASVTARLGTRSATVDTVVPADALVESPQGWLIVAIVDGTPPTAAFVPVQILAQEPDRVAVASFEPGALAAGMNIVVTGTDNVFPGAPLLLQPHADPTAGGITVDAAPAQD